MKEQSVLSGRIIADNDAARRLGFYPKLSEETDDVLPPVLQEFVELVKQAIPCTVCGFWIIRPGRPGQKRRTCSPKCSKIWRNTSVRFALSDEEHLKHRQAHARTILRRPESHTDADIAWAKKMLENPLPPNRRFSLKGSLTTQVLQQIAPNKVQQSDKPLSWAEMKEKYPERVERIAKRHRAYKRAFTILGRRHSGRRTQLTNEFQLQGFERPAAWQKALQKLRREFPDEFSLIFSEEKQREFGS